MSKTQSENLFLDSYLKQDIPLLDTLRPEGAEILKTLQP